MNIIQAKKIWFFTEGKSEISFVVNLIWNNFFNFRVLNTQVEFQKHDGSAVFIHDAQSGDKIPHAITEEFHWINRSGVDKIIIVCDLEKNCACPIAKKLRIEEIIKKNKQANESLVNLDIEEMVYIFSIPTIEEIYCTEIEITKQILAYDFKEIFQSEIDYKKLDETAKELLNECNKSPIERMKKIYKAHNLTYKKIPFSERFFAKLKYSESCSSIVKRIYDKVNSIILA